MYQNLFPITIIDDFYPDPEEIRNFALQQEFELGDGGWPGKRTRELIELDRHLYDYFAKTLLNVFYPAEFECNINLETSFQLIEARNSNQYHSKNRGWLHHDSVIFGGVVYLTKNPEPNTGTSIYKPKKGYCKHEKLWIETKTSDYKNKLKISDEEYENIMNHQYSLFDETVTVENVYNRCVLFGGNVIHGAKTFGTRIGKDARLTQVFFCDHLSSWMDTYPLCRSHPSEPAFFSEELNTWKEKQ